MQPPPTAADLLAIVGEVLAEEIVPALHGPVQHHARVAASLVGIVERELRLGPAADAAEAQALGELLGTGDTADLDGMRAEIASRLRAGLADEPSSAAPVWQVLMDSVRADLGICKPGHDTWTGD